jgi:hypothetical protein
MKAIIETAHFRDDRRSATESQRATPADNPQKDYDNGDHKQNMD